LADVQGANLRFKSSELAEKIRLPRRVKFGGRL
jgi:hypothetical protein